MTKGQHKLNTVCTWKLLAFLTNNVGEQCLNLKCPQCINKLEPNKDQSKTGGQIMWVRHMMRLRLMSQAEPYAEVPSGVIWYLREIKYSMYVILGETQVCLRSLLLPHCHSFINVQKPSYCFDLYFNSWVEPTNRVVIETSENIVVL